MKLKEMNALLNGELGANDSKDDQSYNPKGKLIDLIFPVAVLIVSCTIGMLYVGGFFGTDWWGGTDCAWNFIAAFDNTDAFIGLPWGGVISLVFTIIYLVARRIITFKGAMESIPKGFNAMVPPILILTLAVSLKSMTLSLGAQQFFHDLMEGAAGSLYSMLPAVIFVVACVLAFATGTSWGTIGILVPIVAAIFPASSKLLVIGISACLAGAVCGDHCSPISDTTIMASAGANCNHIEHVSTQIPYALTVAGISFVCFICAGFIRNAVICLIIGVVLTVAVLFVIRGAVGKKNKA